MSVEWPLLKAFITLGLLLSRHHGEVVAAWASGHQDFGRLLDAPLCPRATRTLACFKSRVSPGDIIFSFRNTRTAALGIARSYCHESPKPTEFGTAGSYWDTTGRKIDVSFRELTNRIHPKSHIGELRGLLPQKYSPLRANGDGLQSMYLAEVGRPFAAALFRLIGGEANQVAHVAKEVDRAEQLSPSREPDIERWEESVEQVNKNSKIPDTEAEAIILARVGQGKFRANVQSVERACRNQVAAGAPGCEPH